MRHANLRPTADLLDQYLGTGGGREQPVLQKVLQVILIPAQVREPPVQARAATIVPCTTLPIQGGLNLSRTKSPT